MKSKKLRLDELCIKSFTTSMNPEGSLTIKGGGTEDNTDVQGSYYHCKTTRDPQYGSNDYMECFEPIDSTVRQC